MRNQRGRRRRHVPVLIGVLVMAIAMPTSAAMSASEKSAATTENQIFNVGHLNIARDLTFERFEHDLDRITSQAALIGLNEVEGRRDFLKRWAANHGWYFYAPGPRWATDNALLAKKSMFERKSWGSIFNCDSKGDERPHPRYTNWVRYKHKATDRYVFHINLHANPSIERKGLPRDNKRVRCAKKHFRDVRELAQAKQGAGQVVVTGDLNVDFVADKRHKDGVFPYAVLDEYDSVTALPGLRSSYAIRGVKGDGTHGTKFRRHIDYIYFWKRVEAYQRIWMTDYHIVGRTFSDHQGLVARFAIAS